MYIKDFSGEVYNFCPLYAMSTVRSDVHAGIFIYPLKFGRIHVGEDHMPCHAYTFEPHTYTHTFSNTHTHSLFYTDTDITITINKQRQRGARHFIAEERGADTAGSGLWVLGSGFLAGFPGFLGFLVGNSGHLA